MLKLFSIALIFCLGGFLYSHTLHYPFHFDDGLFIVNNLAIRHLFDLPKIWQYYPCRFITFFTFALNYHCHQFHVEGYHLFNIAVHLGSAVLIWWLTLLTLSTLALKEDKISRHAHFIALSAGLVFVSHPAAIEAVTFIWQRAASMAAFFYLASISLYVKSRLLQEGNNKSFALYYIGSLITGLVALFTKEIAITLPLMILLYEWMFFKSGRSLKKGQLLPFLLMIGLIPLITFLTGSQKVQYIHGSAALPEVVSPWQYILTEFRVMMTYIRLSFLPLNQNFDYDYPISNSIFEFPTMISLFLLVFIASMAIRLSSKYRLISFSVFWFFITLLPEAFPFPIKDVIFEHRLYLPLAGYSLFLVGELYYLLGKKDIKWMVIALALLIAGYSILTYQRNKIWKDEMTLWDDAVRKSPHKARSFHARGFAYWQNGNLAQAIADFNKALELNPSYADVYNNRGDVYFQQGDLGRAISDFSKAILIKSDNAEGYYNRGLAYDKQGHIKQALMDFSIAIKINPEDAGAYYDRGRIYAQEGNFNQAISDYSKAIDINPENAEAYTNRGTIMAQKGRFDQAMVDFSKAIESDPGDVKAFANRGVIYAQQGKVALALTDFAKAISLDPLGAEAYNNRAYLYYQLKEYGKAWVDMQKSITLGFPVNPGFIRELTAIQKSLIAQRHMN